MSVRQPRSSVAAELRRTIVLTPTLCMLVVASAAVSSDDARLLNGLRSRRLFQLAETHCMSRLAEQDLPASVRSDLTVELIRVYAERAMNSPAESRQESWDRARSTAEEFLSDHAGAPRSLLVRVQDALTLLAHGELLRLESEVNANRDAALEAARQVLREATTSFHAIDRELTQLVPNSPRNQQPGALTRNELTSLQHNVRFHLARAYRNQALCFAAGSSDRTASLTEALEQLKQPLLQLAPEDALAVEARLQQIIGLRLLGDLDTAARYLVSFRGLEVSPHLRLLLRAETIRLHLARPQYKNALAVIAKGRRVDGLAAPELDYAFLEAYASMWKSAADSRSVKERDDWRDKSIATAKFIEQTHGNYWGRRAELLLVRIGQGSGDGSLEILRRTADDLYRKRRHADAVAAYEKAAEAAKSSGDREHAFEFAYKAALVEQEQKLFEAASDRFRKAAMNHRQHSHASNAHLLAIVNVRQASAEAREWMPGYADLLIEHLQQWPSSAKTVDIAATWLGEFMSAEGQWSQAVDAYRRVSPSAANYSQAIDALGTCWQARLAEMVSDEPSLAEEVRRAITFYESLIHEEGGLPSEWTQVRRKAALTLAEIRLRYAETELGKTELLLTAAIKSQPTDPMWRTAANALLILTIARQPGRDAEALKLAEQLGEASAVQLLDLFQQVSTIVESSDEIAKPKLAAVQLAIGALLKPKLTELDVSQHRSIERQHARALWNAGQRESALAAYAKLAQRQPNDGPVQEAYANLLSTSDDPATLQRALDQWRRVAAKSRPRSARWFKAKYSIALTQYKLDDKAGAAKLIRYLDATEELAKSGLQQEFQDLLEKCSR